MWDALRFVRPFRLHGENLERGGNPPKLVVRFSTGWAKLVSIGRLNPYCAQN